MENELLTFLQIHMGQKRKTLGMTVDDLAAQTGLTVTQIKDFEVGVDLGLGCLIKVAGALGVEFGDTLTNPSENCEWILAPLPDDIQVGQEFESWTVLNFARKDLIERHVFALCECVCGKISFVDCTKLRSKESTSCGCDRSEKQILANMMKPIDVQVDLRGKRFGYLVVLDVEPRRTPEGHLEFFVHCDAPGCPYEDKWMRSDHIQTSKSCGCQRGKKRKAPELAGQRLGFIEVLEPTRVNGKRTECLTRCVVCSEEKWVRAEQLRVHIGIACRNCTPKLKGLTVGDYYILGIEEKNEQKLPVLLCEDQDGDEVRVLKEEILRMIADGKA